MMHAPSWRGRGLDAYSVETALQMAKVRGMQPKRA